LAAMGAGASVGTGLVGKVGIGIGSIYLVILA